MSLRRHQPKDQEFDPKKEMFITGEDDLKFAVNECSNFECPIDWAAQGDWESDPLAPVKVEDDAEVEFFLSRSPTVDKNTSGDSSNLILDPETGLFYREDGVSVDTDVDDDEAPESCPSPIENLRPPSPETTPPVSVRMLLSHPITSGYWTEHQQQQIFVQPVPLSNWEHSKFFPGSNFLADFNFGRFPWLCDSPQMKRFFCWPCLLCSKSPGMWTVAGTGYYDNNFETALLDHQAGLVHQDALSEYQRKKSSTYWRLKDANMAKCHKQWEQLVRTICAEKKKNVSFQPQDNAEFIVKIKNITQAIFPRTITSKAVGTICNKILALAFELLKNKTIAEVRHSLLVTLHIKDLSPVVGEKTWLVVIARYINLNGEVTERVIDFIRTQSTSAFRSAGIAMKLIKHIFTDYQLAENIVGFSYSPSIIAPGEVPSFHKSIQDWCPRVLFYHSPCDNFNSSLFQAMTHVAACRRYFKEALEVCDFMNAQRRVMKTFEDPNAATLPELFDYRFVVNMAVHYSHLVTIAEQMIATDCKQMEPCAKKLERFLKLDRNRILLVVISEIFSTVAGFADAIEGRPDLDVLKDQRNNSIKALTFLKSTGSQIMKHLTADATLAQDLNSASTILVHYVIDTVIAFLTHRFENVEQFIYTSSVLIDSSIAQAKYPAQSWNFIRGAGLYPGELTTLKNLFEGEKVPDFVPTNSLTDIKNYMARELLLCAHTGLYKYLLYIHVLSFAGTQQKQLLKSVHTFIKNVPPKLRTQDYMEGYFWQTETTIAEQMMDEPELYKLMDDCRLKMSFENEFDVKIVNF